jgi:hypothetical protein
MGEVMKQTHVTVNDDYAVLTTTKYKFYFGYEVTYCTKCNAFLDFNKECECDDPETEWAFYVQNLASGKRGYMRVPDFDWSDMGHVLLECIGRWSFMQSSVNNKNGG